MSSERHLVYQPALDGVRALAVVAVLLFHAEVPGMTGGYLGVSVFFTLSGFLITSLLLAEHDRRGAIDAGSFYARRARRLLPASLLCVALIAVAAATTDWFDEVANLRRDGLAALFQVANWSFLFGGGSYQELFAQASGAVSPFEHFWSLSIEEQFYWVWPLAFLGLMWVARGRITLVGAITVVTIVFAASAPVTAAVWGGDAAYWATPARAAEILVGAWLAVMLARTTVRPRAWMAAPALLALTVACVTFPTSGGPAYAGALPLVAVVTGALLFGLQADGPVRTVLSARTLVFVGTISYGLYLYHWPIFVVVNPDRTGFEGPVLFAARLALTIAAAIASFYLLERPIREGARWRPQLTLVGAGAVTVVVALFAVLLIPSTSTEYWQLTAERADAASIRPAAGRLADLAAAATVDEVDAGSTVDEVDAGSTDEVDASTEGVGSTPETTLRQAQRPAAGAASVVTSTTMPPPPVPSRPVRIVVAGDSTAQALGAGLVEWAAGAPELAQVELWAAAGCGFVRGGELAIDGWRRVPAACDDYVEELLPTAIERLTPDVVMLMTTSWDVFDRRWPGTGEHTPTDAVFAQRMGDDFSAVSQRLLAAGAERVVWVQQPLPNVYWLSSGREQEQPDRQTAVHRAITSVAATDPRIRVVDLASWHSAVGLDDDRSARPDGVHWSVETAQGIATEFLGGELIREALV
jgi:peptidoglycan/LPS O-acetylase OafA/YrhL